MTDDYLLRNMFEAEQSEFVSMLRGLTPEQWTAPSLCAGWSVRDAVTHIAIHVHTRPVERFNGLIRAGLNEQRQMEPYQAKTTDELTDWLAAPPKMGGHFDILTQLAELVIHHQDVRRPLGLDRAIPAERLAVVLDFGIARFGLSSTMSFARRRAKGLRLVAPDIGWWAGDGPEVRGPGEAILMALNGRGGATDQLTGDGVATLASRIKA